MSTTPSTEKLLTQAVAKLDKTALGLAVGTLVGLLVFLATQILLLKGGDVIGPNLALLGQFFAGYTVSVAGSFIGLGYGFAAGFMLGWLMAFFHNLAITLYLFFLQLKANLSSATDYLDPDHSRL
ncbi:MAG TPA: hypothetical protein VFG50_01390 [Rhodothermales bacterium]|nr:hypothetical protein [Rhodothermales bacterium]